MLRDNISIEDWSSFRDRSLDVLVINHLLNLLVRRLPRSTSLISIGSNEDILGSSCLVHGDVTVTTVVVAAASLLLVLLLMMMNFADILGVENWLHLGMLGIVLLMM